MNVPNALASRIDAYCAAIPDEKLRRLYRRCALSTWETALRPQEDGTVFVLTGDIPAMWLRDSAAQVTHYLPLSADEEVGAVIEGVLRRQLNYIAIDPYTNAFNPAPNDEGWAEDLPPKGPWAHERKYEVDSLCYPIRLLYLYWKHSGRDTLIREKLESTAAVILGVWQRH